MIYFTSDLHFFNRKALSVGQRVFGSAQERQEFLVRQWNSTVGPEDEVYLLGDSSDGKGEETGRLLGSLNGRKSVSYTHLDVYKRQALGGAVTSLAEEAGTAAGSQQIEYADLEQLIKGANPEVQAKRCLLYTSRCV